MQIFRHIREVRARIACKSLGQPSEATYLTYRLPTKALRLHAFWKIWHPFGGEEKLTTTIVLHGTARCGRVEDLLLREHPTNETSNKGKERKKNMKHRASFAWKRLRRLEIAVIGHSAAAPRYGAVDWYSEGYLACPPLGAEWRDRTTGYLPDGFWKQLPCAMIV